MNQYEHHTKLWKIQENLCKSEKIDEHVRKCQKIYENPGESTESLIKKQGKFKIYENLGNPKKILENL